MSDVTPGNRLDRPVDEKFDHILGPADAPITLVEYGSYACPYCRAANERIAEVRDQFGDRMRYVFRHRPLTGVEIARRAAELVERAPDPKRFWEEHIKLMTRSETLTEERSQSGRARPRRACRLRPARKSGRHPEDAGRCGRGQRRGERSADHTNLFHQWPPLRRALGRERAC